MKKIVMLPLDERPCNFRYPVLMPASGCELLLPPRHIMGNKKQAGDTEQIAAWLLANAADADALILSLDTLVYGGIVPSRLHHETEAVLCARVDLLRTLREQNPSMKLYVFGLIMRCPQYSSDDEEPAYYGGCGAEIHQCGRYAHLEQLGMLTESDRKAYAQAKEAVAEDALHDYLTRRRINLAVLMHGLTYAADGTVDYFVIPQDDSAVYGYTAMDQLTVREYIKTHILHAKTAMYPSADDTGLTLLARAVTALSGVRPKVYVHYASAKGGMAVPLLEDRILDETLKHHIVSAGGVRVYSLPEADILLAVNIGSAMVADKTDPPYVTAYDLERNLAEFTDYMAYALEMGKTVAVADVAWLNGADTELTALMEQKGLLTRVHAYAGWNTSSNTVGTALCEAILFLVGGDEAGNRRFLAHRYYEDIGYMSYTRAYVTEHRLPEMGLGYRDLKDGADKTAAITAEVLAEYMKAHYPTVAGQVADVTLSMPWNRMFEIDLRLTMTEE